MQNLGDFKREINMWSENLWPKEIFVPTWTSNFLLIYSLYTNRCENHEWWEGSKSLSLNFYYNPVFRSAVRPLLLVLFCSFYHKRRSSWHRDAHDNVPQCSLFNRACRQWRRQGLEVEAFSPPLPFLSLSLLSPPFPVPCPWSGVSEI